MTLFIAMELSELSEVQKRKLTIDQHNISTNNNHDDIDIPSNKQKNLPMSKKSALMT